MEGYPVHLFNRMVQYFITKVLDTNTRTNISTSEDSELVFLVLPYFGKCSEQLRTRFRQFCKRFNVKGRFIVTPYRVSRYFSLKNKCPKLLRSMVCYKYSCPVDQAVSYISRTKRQLLDRVEHLSVKDNNFSPIATIFWIALASLVWNNLTFFTVVLAS